MNPECELSYEGIDLAVLIHALYHGTRPQGMGHLHDKPDFSLADAQAYLDKELAGSETGRLWIDYLLGRPLKLKPLDTKSKTFYSRLYDRDAGHGQAQYIIDHLRKANK